MTQHWFIGWDEREKAAYDVAAYSLLRHASCDVVIHPLRHRQLRHRGLFWREWRLDGAGQWWDMWDEKPFSTEFAFTRFLVPHLARDLKLDGWAFFVDCDFLFRDDVGKLDSYLDPSYALMCVQHDFAPEETIKMDGQIQARYRRKNWSSFMAFNLRHAALNILTPRCVSTMPGGWLHGFNWIRDELIGALPPQWNRLVGHFQPDLDVSALHYTDGGPWLEDGSAGPMDREWLAEAERLKHPTPTVAMKRLVHG